MEKDIFVLKLLARQKDIKKQALPLTEKPSTYKEINAYSKVSSLNRKIKRFKKGRRKYSQVHVEFFGRREASIDGLYGVLEYDGERIRLSAGKEEIIFCGKGLSIDVFDLGQAVIHGEIMSMEFCK